MADDKVSNPKKSIFGSWIKTIILGDAKDIGRQLVTNVVVPRLQNTLCELVDQGARGLIYGDTTKGRTTKNGRTEYNSIFDGAASSEVRVVPISSASIYTRAQSTADTIGYTTIWYSSKEQAYSVLQQMRMELSATGYVTVAKYYMYSKRGELVNDNYTTNYYGWKNLDDAYPYENANGLWRLAFPYQPIRVSALK